MRPIARNVHVGIAWLLVAVLVFQVWLAGRGVFESPSVFGTHRDVGYTISLFPLVLLVLGFLGGMGRRVAIMAAVILGLVILQSVFVALRSSSPAIARTPAETPAPPASSGSGTSPDPPPRAPHRPEQAPDPEGQQCQVGDHEAALEVRRHQAAYQSGRRERFPQPAGVLLQRVGGLGRDERAERDLSAQGFPAMNAFSSG